MRIGVIQEREQLLQVLQDRKLQEAAQKPGRSFFQSRSTQIQAAQKKFGSAVLAGKAPNRNGGQ